MTLQDPIADMIARLKNAGHRKHRNVEMPSSKLKEAIAEVLNREGYVDGYEVEENDHRRTLHIDLDYSDGKFVIEDMERVSRPSRRAYVSKDEIPRVLGGLGTAILTTSEGVLTGKEARESGIGGEVLLKVW